MNLKKVGLAAILSSAFAFVACDNSVAASNDTVGDNQPALSSESTGGDTVTSSDGTDIFASSASVATSTDSNPALSSASTRLMSGNRQDRRCLSVRPAGGRQAMYVRRLLKYRRS